MSLQPELPILFVDDEAQFLQSASFAMKSVNLTNVRTCSDSRQVMDLLARDGASLVVLDMMMPHLTGRELLPRIAERFPHIPVVMLTAVNDIETAVGCMKAGAVDYLVKPVEKSRLLAMVGSVLERSELAGENRALTKSLLLGRVEHPEWFEHIVGRHPAMLAVFQYLEAIGRTALPVLVHGETGCGKELIARAIHKASGRSGEFVAVNAAGLDDALFSDTLFGHEKGAFTGADGRRQGLLVKAKGGTLFLDEIGDLKPESQIKLLRLLDEKQYYPVGSDVPVSADARIVAATHRNLEAECDGGRFRRDLFYRLQSHTVALPPLRERPEDIPMLADHFLELAAAEIGGEPPTPPPELYVLLQAYHFPGNVRELRGMVFDAVSRHKGGVLSLDSFKNHIDRNVRPAAAAAGIEAGGGAGVIFTDQLPTLREIEQLLVDEALRRSKDNQSIASRMLGITRSALNKRINHPREE